MTQATTSTLSSVNPATAEVVGEVAVTAAAEIPQLVARAQEAQRGWGALSLEERKRAILPAGTRLVERAEELGTLLTREMGKPLAEGIGEVRGCGASIESSLDEMIAALAPRELEDKHTRSTLYHDPFGVCAAITPWNFPMAMPHWMVLPALIAGNSVILKPSEETPLIADAYVKVLQESLPRDVLQVVHGADDQGKALVAADVDLIAFTGSRETGKKIMAAAAEGLKRVILELGGKDPMIVLEDSDLDRAAKFAVQNSFRNAGQVCVSTERIYVHESIATPFEEKMAQFMKEMKVGDGREEGTRIGPMISARQRDHVLKQIADAVAQGARVVAGAEGHHGNYVMPTIIADLADDAPLMRDETFGPVACVTKFSDDDEAVRRANDTPFGLGAVVFGGDEQRASGVARRLDAGMIGVNKGCGGASGSPWVGAKESGYGFHGSHAGHQQFAQVRVVSQVRHDNA